MRHDFIDRYSRIESPVHRLPAGLKLICALSVVLVCVLLPVRLAPWYGAIAAGLLVTAITSRIPLLHLLLRVLLFQPFVLGVAALALFQPGGFTVFCFLVMRGSICLFAIVLFSNVTPFSGILKVMRSLRIPALLITTLALMYRYIFVLIDESERMHRARASRTFHARRSGRWHSAAGIAGQLFVRSTERAERIYSAMCARGWR
jgi:cobalt/nickel transport system permease protein